jgi:hypothetical protein
MSAFLLPSVKAQLVGNVDPLLTGMCHRNVSRLSFFAQTFLFR